MDHDSTAPASVESYRNPVLERTGVDHGDPFVLETSDGYVLYHTGGRGIRAYMSVDLVHWEDRGTVLQAGMSGSWAQADLWAPEVVLRDGTYFMYVAGTVVGSDGRPDDDVRRLGVARSPSPLGPFRWDAEPLLPDVWAIDGHVYQDTSGDDWLFYNVRDERTQYVDGSTGCGNVADRLLAPDRLAGAPVPVAVPDVRWEGNREGSWYWNEGAWVTDRQGRLVQMFSGGWFADETYGVGVATADEPRGPWHKDARNPLLRSGSQLVGPGHNSLALGPDGFSTYAVYHARRPRGELRVVMVERLRWLGTAFVLGDHNQVPSEPSAGPGPVPPPAVHDPDVPHWRRSLWWSRGAVGVGDVLLDPSTPGPHRLVVTWCQGQASARLDGRHVPLDQRPPDVQLPVQGVLRDSLSSGLIDEPLRQLAEGERKSWSWGGHGPVEATLSVQGLADVRLGDVVLGVCSNELTSVRLVAAQGAAELSVEARAAARVGDLEMVARPHALLS